jgi:hypothetical protein
VKIYLLSIDNWRFFFYADESEASADPEDAAGSAGPASSGLWSRLHDRFQRLLSAWEQSESGAILWTRRVWSWLHSWAHPDESMLVRLRSARRIELHHPASRRGEEVRALWAHYLSHRWWRHLAWLSVNSVIAPFTVVFAPLPGPNVIGYWFAYRAIHHGLIVWGIRRLWRNQIPLELHSLTSLDRPVKRNEEGKAKHEALNGAAALLDEHIAWSESESLGTNRAKGQPAAAPEHLPDGGSEEL